MSALPSKRRARLNTCHSRPVRARRTRCRCFYMYVLVSLSHHKTTFHNISYVLEQFGTGKPCVICQDKTRLVEFPLRVGTGARCVRAEGSRSLARPQGQRRTHPVEGTVFLFLCHPPITRQAACGRSRRTSSSSGSSARRAGLEEARLVNLARQSSVFPVLWQAIPVMMRLQRGCWATSRRRSSRRALQVCLS